MIGISSYTFPWAIGVPGSLPSRTLDTPGLLKVASDYGVSVVQVADNMPLDQLTDADLRSLVAEARSRKVTVQPGTRGLDRQRLLTYLDIAKKFGSPLVRTITDTRNHEPEPAEVVACLREVAADYEKAGVKLALENHDRLTSSDFLAILRGVSSPALGVCLDTVNSFGALEGPEVVLDRLLPHAVSLHLKDFTVFREPHKMGFRIEGRPAGKGRLDIPALLARMVQGPFRVDSILELWTPWQSTIDETVALEKQWADESISYLNPLFREAT